MTNPSNEPVAKAVSLTTGIGLQWVGDPLPAGTMLFTHALPAPDGEVCTWTQHDDIHMPSTYETECGELWSFVEGGPLDNKTKFCHSCGGLVCVPIVGLQLVHDAITDDPSLCEPPPKRPTNCGTGHCSCIECVMEPAPSTPLSRFVNSSPSDREAIGNAAVAEADAEIAKMTAPGTAVERSDVIARLNNKATEWAGTAAAAIMKEAADLLQSTPDARPVGELTLAQITRIYDRYGGDMVNCTRAIERELAAARTQPDAPLTLGQIAIEELLQLGYTINGNGFERHTWPSHLHIIRLLAIWEDRSRDAQPVDAMLINKCIRELREAAKELQK